MAGHAARRAGASAGTGASTARMGCAAVPAAGGQAAAATVGSASGVAGARSAAMAGNTAIRAAARLGPGTRARPGRVRPSPAAPLEEQARHRPHRPRRDLPAGRGRPGRGEAARRRHPGGRRVPERGLHASRGGDESGPDPDSDHAAGIGAVAHPEQAVRPDRAGSGEVRRRKARPDKRHGLPGRETPQRPHRVPHASVGPDAAGRRLDAAPADRHVLLRFGHDEVRHVGREERVLLRRRPAALLRRRRPDHPARAAPVESGRARPDRSVSRSSPSGRRSTSSIRR